MQTFRVIPCGYAGGIIGLAAVAPPRLAIAGPLSDWLDDLRSLSDAGKTAGGELIWIPDRGGDLLKISAVLHLRLSPGGCGAGACIRLSNPMSEARAVALRLDFRHRIPAAGDAIRVGNELITDEQWRSALLAVRDHFAFSGHRQVSLQLRIRLHRLREPGFGGEGAVVQPSGFGIQIVDLGHEPSLLALVFCLPFPLLRLEGWADESEDGCQSFASSVSDGSLSGWWFAAKAARSACSSIVMLLSKGADGHG